MEGLYQCPSPNCGYIYAPAIGDLEVDIEPGTSFEDIPDLWRCPVCGAMKRGFKPVLFSDLSNEVREKLLRLAGEGAASTRTVKAKVISNHNVATFIKELVLEPEVSLDFKAGAHVSFHIPPFSLGFNSFQVEPEFSPIWEKFNFFDLKAGAEKPVQRKYSIASPPSEKPLRFNVRVATPPPGKDVPPGIASSYIFGLKPGDTVTISEPSGSFFVKETDRELCFIGGGSGMAPLRSQILDLLMSQGTGRKISYWYGARSALEVFYEEEFRKLEERYENFSFKIALSDPQPEDNWSGMTGFIHQCILDNFLSGHEDPSKIDYYLCGPPPMIDAVIKMLEDINVKQNDISYDKF